MTAAALIEKRAGVILARWDAVPARIDVPGTTDIVFGAAIGWESDTHGIVECTVTEPPARPHRVTSETIEFDGERVVVTREYETLPKRYFLAEDFVRLVASLPSEARAALRQARRDNLDVDDLWSLLLSKGSTRIDVLGQTFAEHAWPAIIAILEPVAGAEGVAAFRAAIESISTETP